MIDQMNKQQLDKSKDHKPFSPIIQTIPEKTTFPSLDIQPSHESNSNFFEKYTIQTNIFTSAFKLCKLNQTANDHMQTKKQQIIRKHRGNYRKYTVAEKEEAVKQILEGVDAKEISEKYGIPRRNLLRWKKNGCQRKEGGGRPTDGEMELSLYTKIDNKILTTEKEIRAEAKKLSKMTDFKASKGWYCKFSRRYNHWKKQEREKALKNGDECKLQSKELILLPQGSNSSDSDSQSDELSCQIKSQE